MASDVKNVKLGPCSVTFNSVDLGYTKGGVEMEIATTSKKIMVDQFGETSINEYIMGRDVTVRVPLAEFNLTTWAEVIPGASLVSGGSPVKKKIVIASGVGISLQDMAEELVLHPTNLAPTDYSEDVTVHKAAPKGDFKFAYKHDEERVYMVEFTGYVDTANSNRLVTIGDPAAAP